MGNRSDSQKKHGGAPEAPSGGYFDPQARTKQREEDRRLQERYNKLCGPVTVRKVEKEK